MSAIRVLIIEDDNRISEINRRFTEKIEGYEVCGIATSIFEAKELLPILEPDLVLLDVYFPDGNGIDLLWYIRSSNQSVDVIMITAAKEVEAVKEAIRGGAIDYIIKPIVFERFQKTMVKYQEYRSRIENMKNVEQQDVDHLFQTVLKKGAVEQDVPKGIDPLTLQKIETELQEGITAEELGYQIGVSRTTARRYLEFMVSKGAIRAKLTYGTVGRPERRYYLREEV